jgi:uncharacterized protein
MLLWLLLLPVMVWGQMAWGQYKPPEGVSWRQAVIVSEGTRMAAEVFTPAAASGKLPCILMAHGWGGTAQALRRDAAVFAARGYFVAAFDYRGWGNSESRVILTAPGTGKGKFTAEVSEVREVVDPVDFGIDWLNAIHWLAGEPGCDASRIGLGGSSLSGGLVVWAAARDPRVKALHSQVGAMDSAFASGAEREATWREATAMARGEKGYPAPRAKVVGNLIGAPVRSKFAIYAPVEDVGKAAGCAMQFVIAENEELFDNRDHAVKTYERARGPKKLVTVPGIKHYGIYYEARERAQELALAWFDEHLQPVRR